MKKGIVVVAALTVAALWILAAADSPPDRSDPIGERWQEISVTEKGAVSATSALAACTMVKHSGTAAGAWGDYQTGIGTYTYYDPAVECGAGPYPFELTAFSFTLYNDGNDIWPVVLDIVVYSADPDDPCLGPGTELCRFTFTADQATFEFPNVGTVTFPDPCCVDGPVYVGLEYASGDLQTTPSVIFDDNQAPDTCDNWMFYIDGAYYEWYDFWAAPVPGYPLFWVDGETQSANCGTAPCSWNPGDPHKMHFPQLPDEAGWDVNATYPYVLADDFRCTETGPITDVHFWGSWKDGVAGQIDSFTISFHEDIPADQSPTGYSMPGALLWELDVPIDRVDIVQFDPTTLEGWYDPVTGEVLYDNHQQYFQYNICFDEAEAFFQEQGTIYWMNISAHVNDVATVWGWKSTLDRFNDDAVYQSPDGTGWIDMWEPSERLTGSAAIQIDPSGNFLGGFGDPAYGQGWYFYELDQWWNIWFYDHPFAPNNRKVGYIEFDVFPITTTEPMLFEIAVNWSTAQWSIDQPPTDSSPPLPGVDETLYIGRQILFSSDFAEGHYGPFPFEIPDYNPEWVSIDVRGVNFDMPNAVIVHECQPSLNLAFVITNTTTQEEPEACCLPDGTCQDLLPSECISIGGTPQGAGTACSGTLEACCLPDGSCVTVDPLCCDDLGGTPMGPGTSCSAATEACCFQDGTCQNLDPLCCELLGGTPQGAGTQCTTLEACCLPNGTCQMLDPLCCDDLGGTPQGQGTQCSVQTEACCFPDGTCQNLDPLCCDDLGGTPQGVGTVCLGDADGDGVDDACQPTLGACCFSDGTCATVTQADCLAQSGTYLGDGTFCLGDINGNGIDDACEDPWNPNDGHKMHYPQLPDEFGWDVDATRPNVVADDWQCSETGWVKDIHFWGSWLDGDDSNPIVRFIVSIHEDIPVSPTNPYSRPGKLLWEFPIANFQATKFFPDAIEGWYDPATGLVLEDNHQTYYQYDVYLPEDLWFHQDSGTIYWLNITAELEDPSGAQRWGWKSSLEHFNDDATFGVTTTPPIITTDPVFPVPGPWTNPDEPWIISEGIPEGSIEVWPTLSNPTNVVRTPGTEFTTVEYQAELTMEMYGTGSLAGFNRTISHPVDVVVNEHPPDPVIPPDPVKGSYIPIEIVQMELTGGPIIGDPDFDELGFVCGTDFGLPSPGHTTLTELPSGQWNVDSFFDVEYRITFQGAPGSALEGMAGTTEGGPIRLQQGGADVDEWTELYEPPDFVQSMDMSFVITGEPEFICDCVPGDANGDGTLNVGDAVYIVSYIFQGGPPPVPYRICSGDANCDCKVDVSDAVYMINYVFKGGPPPCDCQTWLSNCGPPLRK